MNNLDCNIKNETNEINNAMNSQPINERPSDWVRFDDNQPNEYEIDANHFVTIPFHGEATIDPTNVSIVTTEPCSQISSTDADVEMNTVANISIEATGSRPKSFNNGDIIVSLFPVNESCDWVTRAKFKPHLVPEELMAQSLTLTVEEYVTTMRTLVNDFRFNCYIIFYKRIIALWATLSVCILLIILFSGWNGLTLFIAAMSWVLSNSLGVFIIIFVKKRLQYGLERCIAQVNEHFLKHNLLIGVDDVGNYSCHKINIIFIYFDPKECIECLSNTLNNSSMIVKNISSESNVNITTAQITWNNTIQNIDTTDIIITGSSPKTISQKEKYSERLFLRYSQRWAQHLIRKARFELEQTENTPTEGNDNATANVNRTQNNRTNHHQSTGNDNISIFLETPPRHCSTSKCVCQYIEEHLRYKPMSLNCFN